MKKRALIIVCLSTLCVLPQPLSPFSVAANARDKTVAKTIRFAKGRTSAIVKDTVQKGTRHEYRLSARAGQEMILHLATRGNASFTLYAPREGVLEGGVKEWAGPTPETGEYRILIETDEPASYTLEVTIRNVSDVRIINGEGGRNNV